MLLGWTGGIQHRGVSEGKCSLGITELGGKFSPKQALDSCLKSDYSLHLFSTGPLLHLLPILLWRSPKLLPHEIWPGSSRMGRITTSWVSFHFCGTYSVCLMAVTRDLSSSLLEPAYSLALEKGSSPYFPFFTIWLSTCVHYSHIFSYTVKKSINIYQVKFKSQLQIPRGNGATKEVNWPRF